MWDFEDIQKKAKEALNKNFSSKSKLNYTDIQTLIPFDGKIDWKDIESAFPEWVKSMSNTPQDEFYHSEGDVWTHTKMVVEELLSSLEFSKLSLEDKEIMFWSCLFHDISKPSVTQLNPDTNKITSAGHSLRGMQDARLLMWRAGFDSYIREQVARIIQHHQKPFVWIKKAQDFQIRQISQSVKMSNLILMAKSDGLGRRTKNKQDYLDIQTNVSLFKEACLDNDCLHKPWDYDFENLEARRIYWDSMGESHESREVFWTPGSEVIFFFGLPASGKDYWISQHGEGKTVLSYDDMKKELGVKQKMNDGFTAQMIKEKAKELLRKKEPFIWNATHLSPMIRYKNLKLLKEYGATVRIICFENESEKLLLSRNETRDTSLQSDKIIKMAYNWDIPSPENGHELLWWKDNKPFYQQYLTSKKDLNSPWLFAQENRKFKP